MNLAMANMGSGAPDNDRELSRDLLLGRVGKTDVSRKPVLPPSSGSIPSRRADDALLREILQRVEELSEHAASAKQSIQETTAVLERISTAIDETVQFSGVRSCEQADKTAELSGVLSRLSNLEEKIPDAAAVTAPVQQDIARLAGRIRELFRTLDSRLPEADRSDSDATNEIRLLGKLVSRRIDDIEKGMFGIRHDIDKIDPIALMRKRNRQPDARPGSAATGDSLPVPAGTVPDEFDSEDFRTTIDLVHELRDQLGIALIFLDMTLPDAGRERAAAAFRRGNGSRRLWPWLRPTLVCIAVFLFGALIEATWQPISNMAWLLGRTTSILGWM